MKYLESNKTGKIEFIKNTTGKEIMRATFLLIDRDNKEEGIVSHIEDMRIGA